MSPAPHVLTLAFGVDDAFAGPLAVTLHSVLDGLNGTVIPDVYIATLDMSAKNRSRIEAVAGERANVHWLSMMDVPIDPSRLATTSNLPVAVYFRVFLLDLLPAAVSRVIYFDADLVVSGPVTELWETDLGSDWVMAVVDPAIQAVGSSRGLVGYSRHGLHSDDPYFNAGVLLFDVEAWRKNDLSDRYMDFARDFGHEVSWGDQDGLNVLFAGAWGRLDERWNLQTEIVDVSRTKHPPSRMAYLTEQRARLGEISTAPCIVHYTTGRKPWHPRCRHPLRQRFHEQAIASGYFANTLAYRFWLVGQGRRWVSRRVGDRQFWNRVTKRLRRYVSARAN